MFLKNNNIKIITLIIILFLTLIPQSSYATMDVLKLDIARQTINNYTYKQITHNQAVLEWTKIHEADCYKVYKYNSAKKKYILYKTLSGDKSKLKISGLSPAKVYYFKVKAYCDGNVITSKSLKVKTRSTTTGYFYEQTVFDSDWSGIVITANKATNAQMSRYKINGQKSAIKYNYSMNDKTLYIHVYAKFVGSGVNQKFTYYKETPLGLRPYKTSKYTNKQLVISGIQNCWNIYVKGNTYDFTPRCNFNTKVIFHTTDIQPDQFYITFNIGNEECYWGGCDGYWFFVVGALDARGNNAIYNYLGDDVSMSLPTNHQLKNDGVAYPLESISEFKYTVAHEFGHILGLDDAYDISYNNMTIRRIRKTTETGRYNNGKFKNIMSDLNNTTAVANDIEMILQGQGMAIKGKDFSWQSYATYTDDYKYKKSTVIRKK